jgi:hypothetical protein
LVIELWFFCHWVGGFPRLSSLNSKKQFLLCNFSWVLVYLRKKGISKLKPKLLQKHHLLQ